MPPPFFFTPLVFSQMKIPIAFYFGSQTGTAETFARTLSTESKRKGFSPKVVDLEDFDLNQLKNARLGIFLCATYGEGDPTDNAIPFIKVKKK